MINSLSSVDLGAIEKRILAQYAIPSRQMGKSLRMAEMMRAYGATDETIRLAMIGGPTVTGRMSSKKPFADQAEEMMKLQIKPRHTWPSAFDIETRS